MNQKNQVLSEHFERLKELIPEVYSREQPQEADPQTTRLYDLLKRSLGIIEAVYLQDREMFHTARVEEYGKIIQALKALGYEYHGNEELIAKAAGQLIRAEKKPMVKAKGTDTKDSSDRRAM